MNKITNTSKVTSKYALPDGAEQTNEVSSNEASSQYMTEALVKSKVSAKQYGLPSEEILQTITLSNNAEYDVTDVTIKETIGSGASFKAESVTIDGTPNPNFDIVQGFQLPNNVATGGAPVEIGYTLQIDDAPLSVESVELNTHLTYSILDATDLEEDLTPITISLVEENISITKSATPSAVISMQKLTFTNIIKNNGNVKNTEIMFTDPIPAGAKFVQGSVKIDDEAKPDLDVETGFKLPDLEPKGEVKVTFEVTVD